MQRFLSGFTNAYVAIFALDAGGSLIEELVRLATGSAALLPLRNAIALCVLWISVTAIFWLPLSPRLPARLLLPLFVGAFWLNFGAAPLGLWLDPPVLGLAATGAQCVMAAWAFRWLRASPHASGGWWDPGPELPVFSFAHGVKVLAFLAFVLIPLGLVYNVLLLATMIEVGTHRFVEFDRGGVTLAERSYHRDGREIRLVGMMHIGEGDAYRDVVTSFSVPSTVVLEEGVSDRSGILDEPLTYDGVAGVLGLEAQDDLASYLADPETHALPEWPVLRHADVDLSDFDRRTIDWLERVQGVWAAEGALEVLREAARMSSEEPEVIAAVEHDLFARRNEHLLGEIRAALPDFEHVVVPWGALHLPAIEAAILEEGFERGTSRRRRLLSWSTIGRALAREAPAAPAPASPAL